MRILVDTNVLCSLAQSGHARHESASTAASILEETGNELCLVPQVIYEYWVVVTRPAGENGLGMPPVDAERAVSLWLEMFTLLRDERGIFANWRELVMRHEVKGKLAHDTRLVAAMMRHSIANLISCNAADFLRFPQIAVATPEQVIAGAARWR